MNRGRASELLDELSAAQALWNEAQPARYWLAVSSTSEWCDQPDTWTVNMHDRALAGGTLPATVDSCGSIRPWQPSGLFKAIRFFAADYATTADTADIEWSEYGLPLRMELDLARMADDRITTTVTLVPLPTDEPAALRVEGTLEVGASATIALEHGHCGLEMLPARISGQVWHAVDLDQVELDESGSAPVEWGAPGAGRRLELTRVADDLLLVRAAGSDVYVHYTVGAVGERPTCF